MKIYALKKHNSRKFYFGNLPLALGTKFAAVFSFIVILILSAIVIGNAAYEAGNISGGVLGLETVFGSPKLKLGDFSINSYSLIIGGIAFGGELWLG